MVAITLWPPERSSPASSLAALGVELAHHVVEQHQRDLAALLGEHGPLGEQQGQQRQALLALGAVHAQLASVPQHGSSSRWGP